ncbi:hypothetical protein JTB14_029622 [Gonioctena quinquepunctata]|nr:hypothetical protein JTB14_029622 [Gonioctena quinquepunctata]
MFSKRMLGVRTPDLWTKLLGVAVFSFNPVQFGSIRTLQQERVWNSQRASVVIYTDVMILYISIAFFIIAVIRMHAPRSSVNSGFCMLEVISLSFQNVHTDIGCDPKKNWHEKLSGNKEVRRPNEVLVLDCTEMKRVLSTKNNEAYCFRQGLQCAEVLSGQTI